MVGPVVEERAQGADELDLGFELREKVQWFVRARKTWCVADVRGREDRVGRREVGM